MKILIVMGSPRKGEGYAVVNEVQKQLAALGNVEVDWLWLKDAALKPCLGCHACIRFGQGKCPLKDDTAALEARMLAADGLILVTPVYSNQVSYLMKIFLDRFSYLWHRPRFFGKFAMGIASGGGQFKDTLGYLKQCTRAWGYTWVTELGAAHPDALVPRRRVELEKNIHKTAHRFYAALQQGKTPAPGIGDLLWFRMWRINAASNQSYLPEDFRYWTRQGWFEREYYTGVKIDPLQRVLARGMEKILRQVLRSVYQGY